MKIPNMIINDINVILIFYFIINYTYTTIKIYIIKIYITIKFNEFWLVIWFYHN